MIRKSSGMKITEAHSINFSKEEMEKLHNDGSLEKDGHTYVYQEGGPGSGPKGNGDEDNPFDREPTDDEMADIEKQFEGKLSESPQGRAKMYAKSLNNDARKLLAYLKKGDMDKARFFLRDLKDAIQKVYDMPKKERIKRGASGREWVTSDEANMTAKNMCKNVMKYVDQTFKDFKPRKKFNLYTI